MSGDADFGPWVAHDGLGQPVPTGTLVQGQDRDGQIKTWAAGTVRTPPRVGRMPGVNLWAWAMRDPEPQDVMRYRVRQYPAAEALLKACNPHRELEDA